MMAEKQLVQFKLSKKTHQQLEFLKQNGDFGSISEMIRCAITLLRWVIEKQQSGFNIYAIPPKGKLEEGEKIQFLLPS